MYCTRTHSCHCNLSQVSGFGGVDHVAKFESCDINCAGPFEVNEQGQAIKGDFEPSTTRP